MRTAAQLERDHPNVAWRTPIVMRESPNGKEHYACRFCIAFSGLQGRTIASLPTDPDEVRRHIREAHSQ